ncbi:ankyrin repeat-containing domain protein [Lactarius pseudohatsudake]|nr:ankyrin repeat-containing domain protein [Lactarius pseudohatsudake]
MLSAESALDLFRGSTSFAQLWFTVGGMVHVLCAPVIIQDSPTHPYRGFMLRLDTARNWYMIAPSRLVTHSHLSFPVLENHPHATCFFGFTLHRHRSKGRIVQLICSLYPITLRASYLTPSRARNPNTSHVPRRQCGPHVRTEPTAGQLRLVSPATVNFTVERGREAVPVDVVQHGQRRDQRAVLPGRRANTAGVGCGSRLTTVQLYNVEDQIWQSDRIMERMATPLYYVALCGFRGLVEHLLIKYPEHVNALGNGSGAALHAASARNHVEVAQLLLERDGDVDVRGKWERSPLQFASIEGHVEMGQFLLDHGTDMLLEHKADINSRTDSGEVPLHWASKYSYGKGDSDYPGVVRLLLEHGADVDVKDSEDATPLHAALFRGETEVVRLLLGHGANAHAEDKWGRTPLQVALANGKKVIAQMLTEHGAQLHE